MAAGAAVRGAGGDDSVWRGPAVAVGGTAAFAHSLMHAAITAHFRIKLRFSGCHPIYLGVEKHSPTIIVHSMSNPLAPAGKVQPSSERSHSLAMAIGIVTVVLFLTAGCFLMATVEWYRQFLAPLVLLTGVGIGLAAGLYWSRLKKLTWSSDIQRVADSEAQLAGIIRSSMEAIITVDSDQRVVLFNPTAETLFAWPAELAIGRPLSDFIPERYRAAHEEHVRRFGITGVSDRQMGRQRALYALRRDGTEFPIEASISQTAHEGTKLYTVMLRDITERARAEDALRRSREELQQLSDGILAAREEERRRIARELHDDLGQRLSALKMDMAMLGADVDEGRDTAGLLDEIGAINGVIDNTVASVRRIASDLRPALLDELGMIPAIEWLADDFANRYGLAVSVDGAEVDVPGQTAIAVFRIVQEALSNVVRHADATTVHIQLTQSEGQLVLQVQDDGVGWDKVPSASGPRKSLGLLGIRERARLLGGSFTIDSTLGKGFCLTVKIPHEKVV